jgi:thiol-disulfide isomerase/thioredoxin
MMVRFLSSCLLVASLGWTSACGQPSFPQSPKHDLLGQPSPEIKARQLLDGSALAAGALAGRVVVVKFFADYCAPCKKTLPAVEALHRRFGDVAFIGVSEDESRAKAQKVVDQFSLTFPVIHDSSQVYSGRFRVAQMPTTFVIDKLGVVRWVGGADQTDDELTQAIEAAR